MKKLVALLTGSSQEMRQVRIVTVCAMMAVIGVVSGSLTICITDTARIGFSGIPVTLMSYLLGPVMGGTFGGALDVLKYLVEPIGPFTPGLTLIVVLKGLLCGCFFYRKPLILRRVLAVQLVVVVVYDLFLSTLCLSLVYGKAFMVLLTPCIIRNLIMWPVDASIFFNIAKVLEMTGVLRILGKTRTAV